MDGVREIPIEARDPREVRYIQVRAGVGACLGLLRVCLSYGGGRAVYRPGGKGDGLARVEMDARGQRAGGSASRGTRGWRAWWTGWWSGPAVRLIRAGRWRTRGRWG